MTYLLLTTPENGILLAEELADAFLTKISLNIDNLNSVRIQGTDLLNSTYGPPLIPSSPNTQSFQLIMHSRVWNRVNYATEHPAVAKTLDLFLVVESESFEYAPITPVDDEGKFTNVVNLNLFVDYRFSQKCDGQNIKDRGALVHQNITNISTYDWRSKEPVIVRATEQWFANVKVSRTRP